MSEATAVIEFDQETLDRLQVLVGRGPAVTGAHCGDDDEIYSRSGGIALGAHCGDDDE